MNDFQNVSANKHHFNSSFALIVGKYYQTKFLYHKTTIIKWSDFDDFRWQHIVSLVTQMFIWFEAELTINPAAQAQTQSFQFKQSHWPHVYEFRELRLKVSIKTDLH